MSADQRVTIKTPVTFRDELPVSTEVVVIGGGVIGVFTALFLAREGKSVLLCEKGRIAGEQSSRNWGWIRQHGRDFAELPIMIDALRLWHEVNEQTDGACGITTGGSYYLASSQEALDEYAEWVECARDYGVDSRLFSQAELPETGLELTAPQWVGATGTSSDARGEPWRAVPAVARLASHHGAFIREHCAVRALSVSAGEVKGVVTEQGEVACEQVVLAGGAWSSLLARQHGVKMPQLAVKGTVVKTAPLPSFAKGNYCDEALAFRRRDDGSYSLAVADKHDFFIGPDSLRHARTYWPLMRQSWRELDLHLASPPGFPDAWGLKRRWHHAEMSPFERVRVLEPTPNSTYVSRAIERFASRFPQIGRPAVEHCWAGMVDAMPDIVPIVDRVPDYPALVVATGMSGHGFGIGPGFGEVIAKLVAGDSPGHDLSRFHFSRFTDGSQLELGTAL